MKLVDSPLKIAGIILGVLALWVGSVVTAGLLWPSKGTPAAAPTGLTCPEVARVVDAVSRSNGVIWKKVTCQGVKPLQNGTFRARIALDNGSETQFDTITITRDDWLVMAVKSTGSKVNKPTPKA